MQTITNTFYNIKSFLKSKESDLVKKYFTLLGYKYTSTILNNNFFHFATEALLMTISKAMDKEFLSSEDIPMDFLKVEVNEEDFQSNLEVLLGTADLTEHEIKFSNSKLASIFLNNFLFVRQKEANKQKNSSDSTISAQTVEHVFRLAVNSTINELSCDEDLYLFETFQELEETCKGEFTLEKYIEEYKSKFNQEGSSKKNSKFCVQNPCEVYYFFSKAKFGDFVEDLVSFNKQSSSIIYVIIAFLKAQYQDKYEKVKYLYCYSKKHAVSVKNRVFGGAAVAKTTGYEKLEQLNKWVKESYTTANESLKGKFPTVHSRLCYLNENYLFPIGTRVYTTLGTSYTFILANVEKGKNRVESLKGRIVAAVSETYQITKEKAEELISITRERMGEVRILQITFDKLRVSKEEFVLLLERVNGYIRDFNLQEFRQYAVETLHSGKNNLMKSYYKFLGCGESDGKRNVEMNEAVETENTNLDTSESQEQKA